MRIDPIRTARITPPKAERSLLGPDSQPPPAAAHEQRPDAVELSESSRDVHNLRAAAAAAPDVRADRVAALKAQVQSGSYTVDNQTLAAKLLTAL
jgi:negative regulator of flagellin synthesis FlgM